jgi:hypothetical protein
MADDVTTETDPEEIVRAIERTREELARTVDTIAGRLDPRTMAKYRIGRARAAVVHAVDGARDKLGLLDGRPTHDPAAFDAPAAQRARARWQTAASGKLAGVPKPAIGGGLAALLALAAVLAAMRRRRR